MNSQLQWVVQVTDHAEACADQDGVSEHATSLYGPYRARLPAVDLSCAYALDGWRRGGRRGPRPPGRLRPHLPEELSPLIRLWAVPVYRLVYDPDGRPVWERLRGQWRAVGELVAC